MRMQPRYPLASFCRLLLANTVKLKSKPARSLVLLGLIAVATTALASTVSSAGSLRQLILGLGSTNTGGSVSQPKAALTNPLLMAPMPDASSAMTVERHGHTATLLADGSVLIVGGENSGGLISQSEIFDPTAGTFSVSGNLNSARADHSATRLADGRVLIAGGRGAAGALTTTEILDPTTGAFASGPAMSVARAGHSATLFADGRVFIAGGDATGSAEIFDPSSSAFSAVGASMSASRSMHSAALLADGRVLLVGGRNAAGDALSSGEIFDPSDASFADAGSMEDTHERATLRVLPDGKVQIIGGDDDHNAIEIYDPAAGVFGAHAHDIDPLNDEHAGLIAELMSSPSRAALIHNGQTITELPGNIALGAGGVDANGNAINAATIYDSSSASVTTDALDYAPGTPVIINGRSFQANELVDLTFHEDPHVNTENPHVFTVQADANGNFTFDQYSPEEADLGITYILGAKGQSSGWTAQTTFTDAELVTAELVSPVNDVTVTQGLSTPFTISVSATGSIKAAATPGTPATATVHTAYSISSAGVLSSGTPSGALDFWGGPPAIGINNTVTWTGAPTPYSVAASVSAAATTPVGDYTITLSSLAGTTAVTNPAGSGATLADGLATTITVHVVAPACTAPSVTTNPTNQTATYGAASVSFTAAASGTPAPTVQWQVQLGGVGLFSNLANNATYSGVTTGTLTITSPTVSLSGNKYQAVFTNTCGGTQTATSTAATLTVNKATAVVVVTPYTCPTTIYNGLSHTATVTSITGVNGETGAAVGTVDVSNTTHTAAGTYASDYWFFTGTANYNDIGNTTISDCIAKATAVVVVTPYNVQYDGNPHTATYSITGVNGETGAAVGTVDVSNTTHTLVGTYSTDTWSFTGTANYNNIASTTITDVITTAYCFNGFLSPIGGSVENVPANGGSFADPVRAFKLGSTIPVKFIVNSLNGSTCGAVVTTGIHTLQAIYYSPALDPDQAIDATPTDAATTGNQFRLTNPEWHFNLSTKGGGFKAGTWLLRATLQDGSVHTVWISIKK